MQLAAVRADLPVIHPGTHHKRDHNLKCGKHIQHDAGQQGQRRQRSVADPDHQEHHNRHHNREHGEIPDTGRAHRVVAAGIGLAARHVCFPASVPAVVSVCSVSRTPSRSAGVNAASRSDTETSEPR